MVDDSNISLNRATAIMELLTTHRLTQLSTPFDQNWSGAVSKYSGRETRMFVIGSNDEGNGNPLVWCVVNA